MGQNNSHPYPISMEEEERHVIHLHISHIFQSLTHSKRKITQEKYDLIFEDKDMVSAQNCLISLVHKLAKRKGKFDYISDE